MGDDDTTTPVDEEKTEARAVLNEIEAAVDDVAATLTRMD